MTYFTVFSGPTGDEPPTVHTRDFGITDSKGRKLGARASTRDLCLTVAEYQDYGDRGSPRLGKAKEHGVEWLRTGTPDGPCFTLHVAATRDGADFGASQPCRHFRTRAERDAALERYFRDAAKRAAKGRK